MKPIYYQISPTFNNNDGLIFINNLITCKRHIRDNCTQIYTGHSLSYLNNLDNFIKINSNNFDILIINIFTHGIKGTGNFVDSNRGDNFIWTPELLWNGFKSNNSFSGLKNILSTVEAKHFSKIFIVASQCYGAYFAESLSKLIQLDNFNKVSIIGFSYNKVMCSIYYDYVGLTDYVIHEDFSNWLRYTLSTNSKSNKTTISNTYSRKIVKNCKKIIEYFNNTG